MNDPQRKGPSCTVEAASSEAQMTQQGGMSNEGPLSYALPTQDRDSQNLRDAQGRWPADVEDGWQLGLYETVEVI